MAHIFGPVPSRRLGRSLGVDLVPPKTCTYDCLYCEVGPTTHLTLKRRAYRVEEILRELKGYLEHPSQPLDFITLTGSGEPTLNLGLNEVIGAVKALTGVKVAVLTNGSLLYREEVRREIRGADVILPSLDAGREETFRRLNRPHPRLSLALLVSGLKALRREFSGAVWLEVMLLKGLNDGEEELTALRDLLRQISPDLVQLNTAVRPVADSQAQALDLAEMEAIAGFLGPGVEVVAQPPAERALPGEITDEEVLQMVARRPMTARDLALALGKPLKQVDRILGHLVSNGRLAREVHQGQDFYRSFPAFRSKEMNLHI
jgi:wyosine [tRNA(Phe)-imidazoG37] synthetase (radical SAM superfamily)